MFRGQDFNNIDSRTLPITLEMLRKYLFYSNTWQTLPVVIMSVVKREKTKTAECKMSNQPEQQTLLEAFKEHKKLPLGSKKTNLTMK